VIGAISVVAATTFLPPVIWPDTRVPASVASSLAGARHELRANATERSLLPLHLSFVEARCSNTGAVALVFEEHRFPYLGTRFAFAARGAMPTSASEGGWGGGVGISGSVLDDPEFINLMGTGSTSCEG
jgi:hypothetical protein